MGIRVVAIDLGGVLLLPDPRHDMRWRAEALGLSIDAVQKVLWDDADVEAANRGQITAEEFFSRSAARLGVPAGRIGKVIGRFSRESLTNRH
jgi:hypothetical protein